MQRSWRRDTIAIVSGNKIGNGKANPATVKEFKNLVENTNVVVKTPQGKVLADSDTVYTGCKVFVNGKESAVIVIRGAILETTGKSSLLSLLRMAKHFTQQELIKDI